MSSLAMSGIGPASPRLLKAVVRYPYEAEDANQLSLVRVGDVVTIHRYGPHAHACQPSRTAVAIDCCFVFWAAAALRLSKKGCKCNMLADIGCMVDCLICVASQSRFRGLVSVDSVPCAHGT
jgi:hypothetical protein